jgi:hypothetical protein
MKIYDYLKDKFQEHLPMFMVLYSLITILLVLSMILLYLDHEEMISFIDIIHHNHPEMP